MVRCVSDHFNLERFVAAQEAVHATALAEIRGGRKRSHWMWFVLPQMTGLGSSAMSKRYAISSVDEARAYLDHPVLGPRYTECVRALQELEEANAEFVFGPIDAQKLRSSLTLFAAARGDRLFEAALERWFNGRRDCATLDLIDASRHDD